MQLRYAEILSQANGSFIGKATELINEALNHAPNNPNGLWLAGMAANERGDLMLAVDYWERLLPQMESNSGPKEQLQSSTPSHPYPTPKSMLFFYYCQKIWQMYIVKIYIHVVTCICDATKSPQRKICELKQNLNIRFNTLQNGLQ